MDVIKINGIVFISLALLTLLYYRYKFYKKDDGIPNSTNLKSKIYVLQRKYEDDNQVMIFPSSNMEMVNSVEIVVVHAIHTELSDIITDLGWDSASVKSKLDLDENSISTIIKLN